MINTVILIGRLTADPILKQTPTSTSVCSFTLAVNRNFIKPDAAQSADFIDIVAWRQTAEFVSKYFKKGTQIAIEGSIQTRSYEDKNGNKRKAVEVVAHQVHFAESKQKGSDSGAQAPAISSGADEDIPDEDDLPW